MIFNTKFNIGDSVCVIDKEFVLEKCPLCMGSGETNATISEENYEIRCPKCNGVGRVRTTENPIWVVKEYVDVSVSRVVPPVKADYVVEEMLLTKLGVILKLKLKDSVNLSTYEINKFKRSVSEDYVFATREEAQAFCDLANIQEELQ